MLTELMREGGVELSRRWVAALMLAPESEREAIVESVTQRLVELYPPESRGEDAAEDGQRMLHVAGEVVQRDSFVEQVIRSYAVRAADGKGAGSSGRGAGAA